jgi:hypothetical protein
MLKKKNQIQDTLLFYMSDSKENALSYIQANTVSQGRQHKQWPQERPRIWYPEYTTRKKGNEPKIQAVDELFPAHLYITKRKIDNYLEHMFI